MANPVELFDFQELSVAFFLDKRAILCGDEMGLGKTLQAVELDRRRREINPNLTRAPKTLVVTYLGIFSGWEKEFSRQTDLRVEIINPKDRKPFLLSIFSDAADVYVIHWQSLRLMPELKMIKWYHIIADECHALQNRKSKQTIALKELDAYYKSGLSGTPAFDKPDDLWSILNWLYPTFWSSFWRYFNEHILFVDNDGYRAIIGVRNVEKLQQEMSGFYMRRRKEEVLKDLPAKYRSEIVVDLSAQQRRVYDQMKKDMLAWIGEHEDEPVTAKVVVAQLIRLQQFSDAYGVIETLQKVDRATGNEYTETHMRLSDPSTKLDAVMEQLVPTGQQLVVFSQYSQVIELLGKRLAKAGVPHGVFIGSTSAERRADIIAQFQAGKLQVFAGTIGAGGVGITLTASSTVVFIDRSWSASLNVQAEDRCHRIGQENAVQVIDILAKDTIDAKRIEKINMQWAWIKQLLGDEPVDDEGGEDYDYDDAEWKDEW